MKRRVTSRQTGRWAAPTPQPGAQARLGAGRAGAAAAANPRAAGARRNAAPAGCRWPHRAAIGVTEAADVSAIVVSEETGIVSVVKRGEITRYVDSESLKKFLRDYYWKEFNTEGKRS